MTVRRENSIAYLPALAAAVLCIGSNRTGILGFLFLLPLGVMAFWFNARTAWFSGLVTFAGNGLFTLFLVLFFQFPTAAMALDLFYFAIIIGSFTWIVAPPKGEMRISTVYRIILSSIFCALALIPLLRNQDELGIYAQLRLQAELIARMYTASSGADVVRRSLSEQYVTADSIMDTLQFLALRGGAVASYLALFCITRQIAVFLSRFFRHFRRTSSAIASFHVPPEFVWVLSCSIMGVLVSRITEFQLLELCAWNVLVISILLYLVQGAGIASYFYRRIKASLALRFFLNVFIIILVCIPGINGVFLGVIILLGIAENWVPFRVPKNKDSSSSTPGI